jgi:ubiquinone biosynthesis accessory factor UbiJ
VLTATLEQLVNRGLPRSPRARQLCAELTGRTLAIEIPDVQRLLLTSNGSTLELRIASPGEGAAPVDATLRGGPFGLLTLLRGEREAQSTLQGGTVTLEGDTHIARQFAELMRLLRPDPEEELSLLVGDVAAHQLGRLARAARDFGGRAADTGLDNLAEFLGHERADLVPRHEGEQFLRGVDALREGVDRAQARLEFLARRRNAP